MREGGGVNDTDDEWSYGPEHPREDERFEVPYAAYPGGEDVY